MNDEQNEEIYHYTTMNSFFKIIENKSIWLSSIEKMNDGMEVKHFIKNFVEPQYRDICKRKNISYTEDDVKGLYEYFDRLYVFCMSREGDLLSQWRGYANDGSGVSIGFSKKHLERLINQAHNTKLAKVRYGDFKTVTDNVTGIIEDYVCSKEKSENYHFKTTMLCLAPEYKNKAFIEEQEWRLIFNSTYQTSLCYDNDKDECVMRKVKFIREEERLKAYHELNFSKNKKIISSVCLGPKCRDNEKDIICFLEDCGFSHIHSIRRSSIPYL